MRQAGDSARRGGVSPGDAPSVDPSHVGGIVREEREEPRMYLDPEQHMVIVKPLSAWVRQATEAQDELRASNGGAEPSTLDNAYRINPAAFSSLIEALYALAPHTGVVPSDDLIRKAGLVPIDQALSDG